MTLRQWSRLFHQASKYTGDAAAAQRGPDVLATRVVRREATRAGFSLLRRLTR